MINSCYIKYIVAEYSLKIEVCFTAFTMSSLLILFFLVTGDGTILGRRRVKAMKTFGDQERTTTGFQSLSVHPDARPDEREQIVALAAVTR